MSETWWTVFAVYVDTEESFITQLRAADLAAAKALAYRKADGVILIAGILEGRVTPAEEAPTDVTPIRGRGHAITVMTVHAVPRRVMVPSKCTHCRADFCKPRALVQADLISRSWEGHLTKTHEGVAAERDHAPRDRTNAVIEGVRLRCAACKALVWDGVRVEKPRS